MLTTTPVTLENIRAVLGWCALMNIVLLTYWFFMIVLARRLVLRLHTRWFPMSEERFTAIYYKGMVYFKLWVLGCNVVPYLALRIVV